MPISRPAYAAVSRTPANVSVATIGSTAAIGISTSTVAIAAAPVSVTAAVSITIAASVSMSPTPTVPGAYAEEQAAVKPPVAVIPIRRAVIRIIGVVAVLTLRGTIGVRDWRNGRAKSYADEYTRLSLGRER
jgi:hypothetical protein